MNIQSSMRKSNNMKTAIIYHYYEANVTYKENLIFFLNVAISSEIDCYVYISGTCSIELPSYDNVKYINIENKNNDFGAAISFSHLKESESYDNYIFINCSVRGPFLTTYYPYKWYEVFTSKLTKKTAIVGSSINLLPESCKDSRYFADKIVSPGPYIHVQTPAFALSSDGYMLLKKEKFFEVDDKLSHIDVILRWEIMLSQTLLDNNFNIASILPTYESFSVTSKKIDYKTTLKNGDPLRRSSFYGRSLSPLETLFVKTNRDIISKRELYSYTFTSLEYLHSKQKLTKDGKKLFIKASKEYSKKNNILEKIATKLTKKANKCI